MDSTLPRIRLFGFARCSEAGTYGLSALPASRVPGTHGTRTRARAALSLRADQSAPVREPLITELLYDYVE